MKKRSKFHSGNLGKEQVKAVYGQTVTLHEFSRKPELI